MLFFEESWLAIQGFVETGGDVLYFIAFTALILWTLITERFVYISFIFPKKSRAIIQEWENRQDTTSWYAKRIREARISEASLLLTRSMITIKTLVAVCPLLGLLGTVTGMIEVFSVIGQTGTSNARLMAAGISKATIPTMSGMVVALSSLFFMTRLEYMARVSSAKLADQMPHR